MRKLPESDWKRLRALKDTALDRFCTRALHRSGALLDAPEPEAGAHDLFLQLHRQVDAQHSKLAVLFDDLRRSTAIPTLLGWTNAGLLTEEELASFSQETRELLEQLVHPGPAGRRKG